MAEKITESKQKRGRGRPTRYSKALGDKICAEIAVGSSLRGVCADEKMPDKSTVLRWLRNPFYEYFRTQYARAVKDRADTYAEEINDLAEEAIAEVNKHPDNPKLGSALVQAYKLKADNLKWIMAKTLPKKYGDKLDVTSGDKPLERPLFVFNMRPADAPKKKSK